MSGWFRPHVLSHSIAQVFASFSPCSKPLLYARFKQWRRYAILMSSRHNRRLALSQYSFFRLFLLILFLYPSAQNGPVALGATQQIDFPNLGRPVRFNHADRGVEGAAVRAVANPLV